MNEFTGDEMEYEGEIDGDHRKIRETWLMRPIAETIPSSELIPAKKYASVVETYYRFKGGAQDLAKVLS